MFCATIFCKSFYRNGVQTRFELVPVHSINCSATDIDIGVLVLLELVDIVVALGGVLVDEEGVGVGVGVGVALHGVGTHLVEA